MEHGDRLHPNHQDHLHQDHVQDHHRIQEVLSFYSDSCHIADIHHFSDAYHSACSHQPTDFCREIGFSHFLCFDPYRDFCREIDLFHPNDPCLSAGFYQVVYFHSQTSLFHSSHFHLETDFGREIDSVHLLCFCYLTSLCRFHHSREIAFDHSDRSHGFGREIG